MESSQQNQAQNQDIKPLAIRVKNANWQVRRRAYEEIYANLQTVSSVKQEFSINNEVFTANKLTSLLNDIDEEKHPIVLLKGLESVLKIVELKNSMVKHFNKLVCEGLQKFPITINQRNQILQKFKALLSYLREQPNFHGILNTKLSMPNEKIVHFAIEVIKDLQISAMKRKLLQISKKHPKKDVKDRAAQVASMLQDEQQSLKPRQQQQVRVAKPVTVKKQQNKRILQVLDKLHHYEQVEAKKQQKITEELAEVINQVALLPTNPQLTNFSYYTQIMIEDNNQIISTNGVKILATLVKLRSQLLPLSFPLLFIFRKFKMHKTHSTNANLFKLTDQLLCSNRSIDLLNAIYEGMNNVEPKVNLKYGCIMTFIRIFSYYMRDSQLFQTYCLGQYSQLYESIQNKKQVQKLLNRCFQVFRKEKDRDYQPIIQRMKEILGFASLPEQKTPKNAATRSESANRLDKQKSFNKIQLPVKNQQIPKGLPSKPQAKPNFNSLVTPQGELNKIMELMSSGSCSQAALKKAIQKCLKCTQSSINQRIFDLFYYCEIAQSFIDQYQPNQQFDHLISEFLISYLITISKMHIKEGKKNSKIVQKGVEYLLRISVVKLVLSKEITTILDNLRNSLDYEIIIHSLGNFLVMGRECPKKKNKKYLIRWLEQNTSEQLMSNEYFELRQAIQSNREKKPEKQDVAPPSVINLPSYEQIKGSLTKPIPKQRENKTSPSIPQQQNSKKVQIQSNNQKFGMPKEEYSSKTVQTSSNQKVKQREFQKLQKLEILENADISHIEKIEQQETDRLEERWQYFLNKKGITKDQQTNLDVSKHPRSKQEDQHYFQEQKYECYQDQRSDDQNEEQVELKSNTNAHYYNSKQLQNVNFYRQQKKIQQIAKRAEQKHNSQEFDDKPKNSQSSNNSASDEDEQQIRQNLGLQNREKQAQKSTTKYYYQPQNEDMDQDAQQNQDIQKQQAFQYVYLDQKRILYMLSNSGKSFSHLRTLVLNPFKKQPNKCPFLRQLTHLIQNQTIAKPQPYKSLLLLVIVLFSQVLYLLQKIKNDKSIIEPLQALYEFMAQHCTNNEFLKTIIGLYHCVIQQTEQNERKFLLTILTKSMNRIMPYVQHPLELLRDFQQFYQIGQLVYFEMYPEEYQQIKQMVENSESLQDVIARAFQQQGQNLNSIVEGWLQSGFKRVIKQRLEEMLQDGQEETE